ncbi:hypothetical protein M422DRAFT_243794 [Sphaerobolus stellatus SS14]|nr:hypothetical protein M422DRAFT_243794 [Sphaerobolus stellatus SS14]
MTNITVIVKQFTGYKPPSNRKVSLYVTVSVGKNKEKTKKIEWKGGSPSWNETFVFTGVDAESTLIFSVFQARRLHSDVCLLTAEKNTNDLTPSGNDLKETPLNLRAADNTADNIGCILTVSITRQDDIYKVAQAAVQSAADKVTVTSEGTAIRVVDSMASAISEGPQKLQDTIEPWEPLLEKIDIFVKLTENIAEVHPYAKMASTVLLSAYKIWKAQRDRDQKIVQLVQVIDEHCGFIQRARSLDEIKSQKDILLKFMAQIIECSEFIRSYARDQAFVVKALKNLLSNVDQRITEYQNAFSDFQTAFSSESQLQTQITIMGIGKDIARLGLDINLNDMNYAYGASYQSGKACLPGTRVEVLQRISDWVCNADSQEQIFLLIAPAGSGKSAIAHSIAKTFDRLGRLGSSFCFRRQDQTQALELFFPTVARDLADKDPEFKKSLGGHIGLNRSFRKIDDLNDQFEQLIASHFGNSSFIGRMLLVIDALDECDSSQRSKFLELLRQSETLKKFPGDIRILVTTRPDDDIIDSFHQCLHVRTLHLIDAVAHQSVTEDIYSFVHSELVVKPRPPLRGIQDIHCREIAEKSQGLFQWTSTVCTILKAPQRGGKKPLEELQLLLTVSSNGLDPIYKAALERNFDMQHTDVKKTFYFVVGFILTVREPLSKETLIELLKAYDNQDGEDAANRVLPFLGALFNGTTGAGRIRPIHTSVRDYLTSSTRSAEFCIPIEDSHMNLSLAILKLLNNNLHFNMCKLENSHIPNVAVANLKARIEENIPNYLGYSCHFIGYHFSSMPSITSSAIYTLVKTFLEKKLLYWLEVLGMLQITDTAFTFLSAIVEKFQEKDSYTQCKQMVEPLKGHTDSVYSVAFSPDGQRVVSGSYDETIRIWDAHTGTLIGDPLEGHTDGVHSVAFSPDGQRVVSGSYDETIRIWDAQTGTLIGDPLEGHTDGVCSVAFSPDGQRVVSGSWDNTIRIWDAQTDTLIGDPLEGHTNGVYSVAFSPDGQRVVSGSWDNTIQIWNAQTGTLIGDPLEGHTDSVYSVAFSHGGKRVVSGSLDNTIRIWNAQTGTLIGDRLEGHTNGVYSVVFSPDGQRVVSGSLDNTIRIWDAQTGTLIGDPLEGHTDPVYSVAFSSDGQRVVSGSLDNTIRIWDAQTGTLIGDPLEGHTDSVYSVAFSPDGQRTGTLIGDPLEGHTNGVYSVAFSPDGQRVVSGSWDNTIQIWNAQTGTLIGDPLEGHTHRVCSVAFSPDEQRVVLGSWDNTIQIWDAQTGALIGDPLEGHTDPVYSVAFSPGGQRVVSGSWDNTIRIWDAQTGTLIGDPLEGHAGRVYSVAFSPDGQRVVSGSWDKTIRIWNAQTGTLIGDPLEGHTGCVSSVAFSPDGQRVVSGSWDKTIRIWDAQTGTPISDPLEGLPNGHTYDVKFVTFSSDEVPKTAFSSNMVHALNLTPFFPTTAGISSLDSVFFDHTTGFITGPQRELILWIPPVYRHQLWLPRYVQVMGLDPVMLDLSQLPHGTSWTQCWEQD